MSHASASQQQHESLTELLRELSSESLSASSSEDDLSSTQSSVAAFFTGAAVAGAAAAVGTAVESASLTAAEVSETNSMVK
jgi:hypothetical protein